MNSESFNYTLASIVTGSLTAIHWISVLNDIVNTACAYVAVIVGIISIYKFIEEKIKK